MPIAPIRALGQHGIITDLSAYDLPANAWTSGRNVRFDNSLLKRGPIFRTATEGSDMTDGRCVLVANEGGDYDVLYLARADGELRKYAAAAWDDVTPTSGYTPADYADPWTACYLSQVVYFNRAAHVPLAIAPGDTDFSALANWDANWRAGALRSFRDTLVALNVTKSGTEYPNMVKWSDYAVAGAVPGSWDETDPTVAAGETILASVKTPLVDGLQLRDVFAIYAEDQVWLMEFLPGNQLIYNFRPLFSDRGVLNVNCVVEIDGAHWVFGSKEIYAHDGVQLQFPARNKVDAAIYSRINFAKTSVAFVHYDPRFREVYFCYNTSDDQVAFPGVLGCNEAAVYNIASGTWSFIDLPNVYHADRMSLNTVVTYASAETAGYTYDTIGGTYAEQSDATKRRHTLWLSQNDGTYFTDYRLLAYDTIDTGLLALPRETEADARSYAQRVGLDFDQFFSPAAGTSIRNKRINSAYLQASSYGNADAELRIRFGGHDYPNDDGAVAWEDWSTYCPVTDEKVDSRMYGRYLAMEIELPDDHDIEVSSVDMISSMFSTR